MINFSTYLCITVKISLTDSQGEECAQYRNHHLLSQPLLIYEPLVRALTANWLPCSITLGFLQLFLKWRTIVFNRLRQSTAVAAVIFLFIFDKILLPSECLLCRDLRNIWISFS